MQVILRRSLQNCKNAQVCVFGNNLESFLAYAWYTLTGKTTYCKGHLGLSPSNCNSLGTLSATPCPLPPVSALQVTTYVLEGNNKGHDWAGCQDHWGLGDDRQPGRCSVLPAGCTEYCKGIPMRDTPYSTELRCNTAI